VLVSLLSLNWIAKRESAVLCPSIYAHTQPFYRLLGFCLGLPGWASTRKVKPGRWSQSGFTGARDSEWQWHHQLGHIQICTLTQTHNHASIPPLSFYRPDALPSAQLTASKNWRYTETKKYLFLLSVQNFNHWYWWRALSEVVTNVLKILVIFVLTCVYLSTNKWATSFTRLIEFVKNLKISGYLLSEPGLVAASWSLGIISAKFLGAFLMLTSEITHWPLFFFTH